MGEKILQLDRIIILSWLPPDSSFFMKQVGGVPEFLRALLP